MRSIGVTRSSGPQAFASQTSAHNGFYAMNRALSRNVAPAARLPKVGVMQSSQRTQLRSVQPAAGILGRTDFGGAQTTVVNDALRRARNAGSCAPKKKGAIKTTKSAAGSPNILQIIIRDIIVPGQSGLGAYTLTLTSQGGYTFYSGFNGLNLSNIKGIHLILAFLNEPYDLYFASTLTPDGLKTVDLGSVTLTADIVYETQDLTNAIQLNVGNLLMFVDGPYFVVVSPTLIECPHFYITIPIDYLQQETCTAFLNQIYSLDESTYYYNYITSEPLSSYPDESNPGTCSFVC